jgi:hypothetical protein
MKISITTTIEGQEVERSFHGREAWALGELVKAGPVGVTPIDNPGPRWSGYVFKLRKAGLSIATVTEPHGGPFAGTHARYVLTSPCALLDGGSP